MRKSIFYVLVSLWIIALIAAFAVDQRVAQCVHDSPPINKDGHITHRILFVMKMPGNFWFTLCVAALVALFHRDRLRGASALVLSGVAVGISYSVIKWVAGRHRPFKGIGKNADPFGFHPFPRGLLGLVDPENALCFPSGHASLAFASAMCLGILMPRARWIFFAIASVTAADRILENAHYCSDVVAGAGLGTVLGWAITTWILPRGISDISMGTRIRPA